MSFPFTLIVENTDDGTLERVEGTEPGRRQLYTNKPIPAVQIEANRPERAIWGCDHGHHNDSRNGERIPFREPRFAYGGVWYRDLDEWAARWSATITSRTLCTWATL